MLGFGAIRALAAPGLRGFSTAHRPDAAPRRTAPKKPLVRPHIMRDIERERQMKRAIRKVTAESAVAPGGEENQRKVLF